MFNLHLHYCCRPNGRKNENCALRVKLRREKRKLFVYQFFLALNFSYHDEPGRRTWIWRRENTFICDSSVVSSLYYKSLGQKALSSSKRNSSFTLRPHPLCEYSVGVPRRKHAEQWEVSRCAFNYSTRMNSPWKSIIRQAPTFVYGLAISHIQEYKAS